MDFLAAFEKYIDCLVDAFEEVCNSLIKEYNLKLYQRHGKRVYMSIENNKVKYYESLIDFMGGNYVI